MPIQGRMTRERERLLGMTPEERKWRGKYWPLCDFQWSSLHNCKQILNHLLLPAQYLKDQHLSKNEPYNVPEYYKETRNPIRRAYMAPLDTITKVLTPVMVSH